MCIRERPCLARARLEKAGKLSRFVFPKGKNSNNLSAKLKDRGLRRGEGKGGLRKKRGGGGRERKRKEEKEGGGEEKEMGRGNEKGDVEKNNRERKEERRDHDGQV